MASRSRSVLLIAALALLAGGAPVWACAMQDPPADCCPENGPTPCLAVERETALAGAAEACCVATPAFTLNMLDCTLRSAGEPACANDLPDFRIDGSPAALEAIALPAPGGNCARACSAAPAAASVYLITGRLRL